MKIIPFALARKSALNVQTDKKTVALLPPQQIPFKVQKPYTPGQPVGVKRRLF